MNVEINNLAPDTDVVSIRAYDNENEYICVNVERDKDGNVFVTVELDDGTEQRMILGQEGYTIKC